MIGIYLHFDGKFKTGPPGPSGIRFKLTNDGNYDMENAILKNCASLIDDQEASSKKFVLDELEKNYQTLKEIIDSYKNSNDVSFLNFVKETGERIEDLNKKSLYLQDGHIFDAKDRRNRNVKYPVEGKNVVNKRFMQKNVIVLKGDVYDAGN